MDSTSNRSTTAEGAAFCRALGALERDQRLRNPDHLAHHFVTRRGWPLPGLRLLARRNVEQRLPGALVLHQVRTRLFDELVLKAARDGVAFGRLDQNPEGASAQLGARANTAASCDARCRVDERLHAGASYWGAS